jgi:hypothetical protein
MASLEVRDQHVYARDRGQGGVPGRCRELPGFAEVNGPLMAHRALHRRLLLRCTQDDDDTPNPEVTAVRHR